MRTLIWMGLLAFFIEPAAAELTRAEFVQAISSLKIGMSGNEVTQRLGKPDDIVEPTDFGGSFEESETWDYGSSEHLGFPTLGSVEIEHGRVIRIDGGVSPLQGPLPALPDPKRLSEADLRALLVLLNKVSPENPLSLIQAVNHLQPLGKDLALALVSEYSRVGGGRFGIPDPMFLVLRLLFKVPADPGYMPDIVSGAPFPANPEDPKIVPLFPMTMIDGVPLYLVDGGYTLGGVPLSVRAHIDYFQAHGELIGHPLQPTDNPLAVLVKLENSPQWLYKSAPNKLGEDRGKEFIAMQLLKLVHSVYRIDLADDLFTSDAHFNQNHWDEIINQVAVLHIKWDSNKNDYVFANGSSLPPEDFHHKRTIWELPQLGRFTKLIIERQDATHITMKFCYPEFTGHRIPGCLILTNPGNKAQFVQFSLIGGQSASCGIAVGTRMEGELVRQGKSIAKATINP